METRNTRTLWTGFLLGLLALCALFPLSGDDWSWAVTYEFSTFNGRYLGNLVVRLLTQVNWVRPLVKCLTIAVIAWGVSGFSLRRALPAMVLLMALNRDMFIQVYQWTSGFCNFTLPVALILLALWAGREAVGAGGRRKTLLTAAVFPLCFAAQLFSENITIGLAVLALMLLLYLQVKKLPGRGQALSALLGALGGLVLMFSNAAYWTFSYDSHQMPTLEEYIANMWDNFNDTIAGHLLAHNTLLLIALTGLLLVMISRAGAGRALGTLLQWGLALTAAFFLLMEQFDSLHAFHTLLAARSIVVPVYYGLVAAAVFTCIPPGRRRTEIVFAFLAAAIFAGPLIGISGIGSRCLYISYAAQVMAVMGLWAVLEEDGLRFAPPARRMAGALLIGIFGFYCAIYTYTALEMREREQALEAQLEEGAQELQVLELTFSGKYVWGGDPDRNWTVAIFKMYYGIPEDAELVLVESLD